MDPTQGQVLFEQVFSLILGVYCIGIVIGAVLRVFRNGGRVL